MFKTPEVPHIVDHDGLEEIKDSVEPRVKRRCKICGASLSIYNPNEICLHGHQGLLLMPDRIPYRTEIFDQQHFNKSQKSAFKSHVFCPVVEGMGITWRHLK